MLLLQLATYKKAKYLKNKKSHFKDIVFSQGMFRVSAIPVVQSSLGLGWEITMWEALCDTAGGGSPRQLLLFTSLPSRELSPQGAVQPPCCQGKGAALPCESTSDNH